MECDWCASEEVAGGGWGMAKQRRLGRGQGRAVYRKTWLMNQHYHVLVSTITKCEPLTNHSGGLAARF